LLAIGSCEGDVAIVDAATLSIQQWVRQAHIFFVTAMEFHPNGQALLTVSADYSARVTRIEPVGGNPWRGSLLLIVIFVLAMLVAIVGDGLLANFPQAALVSGENAWQAMLIVVVVLTIPWVIVFSGCHANSLQAASVFLARLKSRSLKSTPDGGINCAKTF
jgi:hypothetical protein